ncbi:pyrrolo-quinoline quinone [Colletotrichum kahawae]|uniref:Pyrrolo-quinoline quinone n=1 Tax=Colletotrichum kahawae TaxID=34407 RepID=A0AAD9YLU0_COLKA|nr:pyrrolo-quinoline quinone [Colletotrichum kahawae]
MAALLAVAHAATPMPPAAWVGWGGSIHNRRMAGPDAAIAQKNVGSLVKTCEQRYEPAGVSASPLVVDGIAYYPTWTGLLVALDYKSCHVLWTTNVTQTILDFAPLTDIQRASGVNPVSRSSPVTDGDHLFIGTLAHALILVIDKETGTLVSHLQIDDHPVAMITQSPTWYAGQLLVGASSFEVISASLPNYNCCDHVGSMNSVIFEDGVLRLQWKTMMMTQIGNLTGDPFSGASVWGSSPVIDTARDSVYIATGNTHSVPDEVAACQLAYNQNGTIFPDPCLPPEIYQESVLALDLATGNIKWARQLGVLDAWNLACVLNPRGAECPPLVGLDSDFGMGPTLVPGDSAKTPDGKDLIVIGQKNGNLYGIDAESGEVLWLTKASPAGLEGGLSWGVAADDVAVYFTAINNARTPYALANGQTIQNAAFGAAALVDGKILWQTPSPNDTASMIAPTVANDVVVVGSTGKTGENGFPQGSGSLVLLDKSTGAVLGEEKLADFFKGGIAVVQDYLMFGTGYLSGLQPPFAGGFEVWRVDENVD